MAGLENYPDVLYNKMNVFGPQTPVCTFWHLKSPATQLCDQQLVQPNNKGNIKASITGLLRVESTDNWWITRTKGWKCSKRFYVTTSSSLIKMSRNNTFPNFLNYVYIQFSKLTRQNSTQNVGNMPPPSPRHLLPQVLQIMPRNPKYDQFQPKGHHNEENPQSMTKMPGNPKFDSFH